MRATIGALALATLLLWPAAFPASAADTFVQVNKHELTLETKGGLFDYQEYPLSGQDVFVLRARATIQKIERVSDWIPTFGFGVGAALKDVVVLQTRFDGKGPPTAYLILVKKGLEAKKLKLAIAPELGKPFDVELTWTPAGAVTGTLRIGDAKALQQMDLGVRPSELRVLVSGGRLEVAPLQLGRINAESK